MNTATTNAVAAINTDRQNAVTNKAKLHIGNILAMQSSIKTQQVNIAGYQKEMATIAENVLTYTQVTGKEIPTAPNANEASILEAIKKHNDDQQKSVTSSAKTYGDAIVSCQKQIKSYEAGIAKEREELAKLSVEVVTVAEVAGATA